MSAKTLLVIQKVTPSIEQSVRLLQTNPDFHNLQIACITNNPPTNSVIPYTILYCDFASDEEIAAALKPMLAGIVGVVCRGDGNIQYLRKIIKHLPPHVLVASETSLEVTTNKRLMRQIFQDKCPELTPAYVQVTDASDAAVRLVEEAVGYPVIVKPANLMSSMLIQSCDSRMELQQVLQGIFNQIRDIYMREGRQDSPQVIVEEYLVGDFYSIDTYVQRFGEVEYCPIVGYVSAKQLGIDDFFLYKRFIPTTLSKKDETMAYEVSKRVNKAVGLTHSSAHIELILTEKGWKVIEIGPRIGRFRNRMYKLSYGLDHSLNDIRIHLGLLPDIPRQLLALTSCYSIYPYQEGELISLDGFEEAKSLPAVTHIDRYIRDGSICKQAKHGGKALADITISTSDPRQYEEAVQFIESRVFARIKSV